MSRAIKLLKKWPSKRNKDFPISYDVTYRQIYIHKKYFNFTVNKYHVHLNFSKIIFNKSAYRTFH